MDSILSDTKSQYMYIDIMIHNPRANSFTTFQQLNQSSLHNYWYNFSESWKCHEGKLVGTSSSRTFYYIKCPWSTLFQLILVGCYRIKFNVRTFYIIFQTKTEYSKINVLKNVTENNRTSGMDYIGKCHIDVLMSH